MPTPLEDHGGPIPSSNHPILLPDVPNSVVLLVRSPIVNVSLELYASLQLNRVSKLFYILSEAYPYVPNVHPIVEYISLQCSVEEFMKEYCVSHNYSQLFFYELENCGPVNPALWSVLDTAKPDTSVEFQNSNGQTQTLWSVGPGGVFPKVTRQLSVYSTLQEKLFSTLSEIQIEVSDMYTPLCQAATGHMTDKTPYGIVFHRHPYTPVYDIFLRPFQLQETLVLGEVGILNGASVLMWRNYFPKASIHAFDIVPEYLIKVKDIPGVTTHLVDKSDIHSIVPCLEDATSNGLFDILVEDASHCLEHQLHFLKDAIRFVRPGGLLIIEDIFRAIPRTRFQEALDCVREKVHNAVLVRPEHIYRFSPGWENDRILLVWVK